MFLKTPSTDRRVRDSQPLARLPVSIGGLSPSSGPVDVQAYLPLVHLVQFIRDYCCTRLHSIEEQDSLRYSLGHQHGKEQQREKKRRVWHLQEGREEPNRPLITWQSGVFTQVGPSTSKV